MRKFLKELVTEVAYYLEIALSIILAIALIFFTLSLGQQLFSTVIGNSSDVNSLFQTFTGNAMTIAVGIEVIKMFSKPSPNTVIEVLLFAIARQLVDNHPSEVEFLIGIVSVAVLFAVRKYLFTPFDTSNHIIMRASQKVKMANIIARVHIPAKPDETLRDFMVRQLTEEDKTIAVGAVVYLKNTALRIYNMHGDLITRVEIIRSLV